MGHIGVNEAGATGDQSQRWHDDFADGTHGLPLLQEGFVRGVLDIGGAVHVRGEEEAACSSASVVEVGPNYIVGRTGADGGGGGTEHEEALNCVVAVEGRHRDR